MWQPSIIVMLSFVPALSVGHRSWEAAERGGGTPPLVLIDRSLIVLGDQGLGFDALRSPLEGKPFLLRIDAMKVTDFDIFGGRRPWAIVDRFGWNVVEGALFQTSDGFLGVNGLSRYPLNALRQCVPGSGWPISEEKVPAEWKKLRGGEYTDLNFGLVWPQHLLMSGFTWDERGEPGGSIGKSEADRKGFLDIIGLSVSKLRLYFTFGGDLSIWDTDGEKWELVKDHVTTIEGPFLVLDQGRSALVQRDGKWGLLSPLDETSPRFAPLVEREGDEPIRVVEDRDAGVNYFIYKDDILDAQGRVLGRVPPGLNSEERLIHLTRFALARREPK